ncbi:hypothetical protein ACHAXH_004388 [Discostella pseudostelligera]
MSPGENNFQSTAAEVSSLSTDDVQEDAVDNNIMDDTDECVLSQGRICICTSCEEERQQLVLSRKRKRSITKTQTSSLSLMSGRCQEVGTVGSSSNMQARTTEAEKLKLMTSACKTILRCIGEDPNREGLLKTPERWTKALLFMTSGYSQTAEQVLNDAVFTEDSHKEIVVVKDIDIHSMCEHHMVPFTGRIHVGYIPNGKIIGLSKIARIAEVYARRLQVQERLTRQIVDAIEEAVQPLGVGVVIECSHFCMVMRGVQKVGAKTVTSCVRGCFESNQKTRAEFFNIINGKSG